MGKLQTRMWVLTGAFVYCVVLVGPVKCIDLGREHDVTDPPLLQSVSESDHVGNETDDHGNHTLRYHVAVVDFDRVMTPFVVSLWIVFASLAKIGEYLGKIQIGQIV